MHQGKGRMASLKGQKKWAPVVNLTQVIPIWEIMCRDYEGTWTLFVCCCCKM